MPDDDKKGPSKVDDVARLRLQRYMTKGPGAKHPRPVEKPSLEVLRSEVAKVAKKTKAKKAKKKWRRK